MVGALSVVGARSLILVGHLLHDITEAISLYEQLLDCPSDDPHRSWSLEHLPAVLREHRALIGDHPDIVEGTDAEGPSIMWIVPK